MNKKDSQKFCSILIILLATILFPNIIKAQEDFIDDPAKNWVLQYGLHNEPMIYFRYQNYSESDTVKFREKFDLIKNSTSQNEWEGTYIVGFSELSVPIFRWNASAGFIRYYVNSCYPSLESIDYGNVVDTPEYIQLLPEKTDDSPRKIIPSRYVKIKWGTAFYLVKESSLQAFAEKAVGIYVDSEETSSENYQKWNNYMVMGDEENISKTLPQFPPSYKKFQRLPIEAKISTIEKRAFEDEKEIGNSYYSEAVWYYVKIDAGKSKNVKVGMTFDITELQEELFITKVDQNTSIGLIHRDFDENKSDLCHGDEYKPIPCPEIKPSLKVKTQVGKFFY